MKKYDPEGRPLVSIVVPTFNRASTIKRCIESVIDQTYPNWELIIVDNNSSDSTMELLNQYNNVCIKIISVDNEGVIGRSRNIGIKNSVGKYVAFLDSDDWWDPNKLSVSVGVFENNTIDVVYHNCSIMSNDSSKHTHCRKLSSNVLEDLIVNGNTLVTSSVVVLKSAIVDVGCFSEEQKTVGWEDYHLWLKLAEAGYEFKRIKSVLGFCWKGDDHFDTPRRVLLNLIEIENYFRSSHKNIIQSKYVWWLSYARARSYISLNNREGLGEMFFDVFFRKTPLEYKVKSLYFWLYSKLR